MATLFRASIVLTDIAVIPAPRLLGWDCFAASGRLFGGVLCFDMVEKGGRIEDCSRQSGYPLHRREKLGGIHWRFKVWDED